MPAEPPFDPDAFSGVARLFPLPEVVSFPHVVTPLHVFEERYRSLTADALGADGLITMAVLKPGWESEYAGRPPLWPVACLGKIVSHHTDQEGRHNLLLLGLRRVRLLEEISPVVQFRRSRVELIEEVSEEHASDELRRKLISLLDGRLAPGNAAEELRRALTETASLGAVADLAAHSLPLTSDLKLKLLSEPDPAARTRLILQAAQDLPADTSNDHLPPFSMN